MNWTAEYYSETAACVALGFLFAICVFTLALLAWHFRSWVAAFLVLLLAIGSTALVTSLWVTRPALQHIVEAGLAPAVS